MNERRALYRQLQNYFETRLFGLYRWQDVTHVPPEPVKIERDARGRRINQRSYGRWVEKAVVLFDGYKLTLLSPNEIEPPEPEPGRERGPLAPAVVLQDGEDVVLQGANESGTWDKITNLLRDNMSRGQQTDGRQARSAGW